jgi:hypothetical protein
MIDFETAIRQLENSDTIGHAAASADLASAVWNGRIPLEKVLELLQFGSPRVRECLAWAVWDAKSPMPALELLLEHGSEDSSEIVRNYALKAWLDSRQPKLAQEPGFRRFLSDANVSIREKARSVLQSTEGTEQ